PSRLPRDVRLRPHTIRRRGVPTVGILRRYKNRGRMSSDARHTAEEALLSALQKRLNEPGAEYRTADVVSPDAASLLVEARNHLLSPREATSSRDLAGHDADPFAREF